MSLYPERTPLNFFDPAPPDTRSDKIASVLEKYSNALARTEGGKAAAAPAAASCPATRIVLDGKALEGVQLDILHIALVIATGQTQYEMGEYTSGTYLDLLSQFAANDEGVRDKDVVSLAGSVTNTFLGAYTGELRGTLFTRLARFVGVSADVDEKVDESKQLKGAIQAFAYQTIKFQLDQMKKESLLEAEPTVKDPKDVEVEGTACKRNTSKKISYFRGVAKYIPRLFMLTMLTAPGTEKQDLMNQLSNDVGVDSNAFLTGFNKQVANLQLEDTSNAQENYEKFTENFNWEQLYTDTLNETVADHEDCTVKPGLDSVLNVSDGWTSKMLDTIKANTMS